MTTVLHERLLTSQQAAERLGVSVTSVLRWSRAGLLPVVHTPGRHHRYRPADVAAFYERMRRGPFR